jgi:glycosyltransferase 2 family protein
VARLKVLQSKWLPQILGYTISIGCLVWVLRGYNFNELIPTIRSLDSRWVLLAVVADLVVYVVHGWRWKTLLAPVARLKFWRTVQAIYIGLFANELLPLRPGELIRIYLMAHWNDLRISLGFASWAIERLIDGFWLVAAFLVLAELVSSIPKDLVIGVEIMGSLLVLGVTALVAVVMRKEHAHAALAESRWAATLRHVIEGLQLMGNARTLTYTALISLLYLAVQFVPIFALMKADGLDLSFWAAAAVVTVVRIATVIPNAPGNLGLGQAAYFLALKLFEIEDKHAKDLSLIMYLASTLPLLLGGAVATALTGLNLSELRERARHFVETSHHG